MESTYIQTLHPMPGKTNKRIALDKYNFIKENLINILSELELTHTELIEELYTRVKPEFRIRNELHENLTAYLSSFSILCPRCSFGYTCGIKSPSNANYFVIFSFE